MAKDSGEEEGNADHYRATLTDWINEREHIREWTLEGYRTTARFADSAIKAVFLINGGALVALLAYLGSIAGGESPGQAIKFGPALAYFVVGLVLAALAAAFGYASVYWKTVEGPQNDPFPIEAARLVPSFAPKSRGASFHRLTMSALALSLLAFIAAAVASFKALTT